MRGAVGDSVDRAHRFPLQLGAITQLPAINRRNARCGRCRLTPTSDRRSGAGPQGWVSGSPSPGPGCGEATTPCLEPVVRAHTRGLVAGLPCANAHPKGHPNSESVGASSRRSRDPAGSAGIQGALIRCRSTSPSERPERSSRRRARPSGSCRASEGALPRQLPPRPDPSPAPAGSDRSRKGRALPREPQGIPGGARRPAPDRARREIPDTVDRRPQTAGRARDEGARAVRRAGAVAGLLQPRARAGCQLARRISTMLSAHQSSRRRAAAAVRLRGAEAQMAAAGRQRSHLRVPPDRARRRLGPGAGGHDRLPTADGTGYVLNGLQAVGHQWCDRGYRRGDGSGARARGRARRHQRVRAAV